VALAAAAAEAVVLALRPRSGAIEPLHVAPDTYFSREEIDRARRFGRPQLAIHATAGAVQAAMLVALARRPAPLLRTLRVGRPPAAAALAAAGLTILLELATLPLSAIARRRAIAVGLATQSWSAWALDIGKALAIGAPFSGAGGALAVALMRRYPRGWWLPGAGLLAGGGVLFLFAGPLLLDPIFNRFTPLVEGQTRDDVLELADAADVSVRNVYEVDASRRTTAANAYVTGIGASRRVVLFDTLTSSFTRDETRLVVAHELAHVRHRDIARSLLAATLVAPAATHAAAALTRRLDRSAQAGPQTLPALALSFGAVWTLVGLLSNQLSRAVEARADSFALRLTDAPAAFISFERSIALRNLADPAPPRWLSALLGTHPPVTSRIGIALAYEQGAR
jgi:STE24 endopeptidase